MTTTKPDSAAYPFDPYDEAPPWTDEMFERAQVSHGSTILREATGTVTRGRPKSDAPKELVSLRLDPDILDRFRATGPGWRSRINDALKKVSVR